MSRNNNGGHLARHSWRGNMHYKVTTAVIQYGITETGSTKIYDSEADAHRGFLDAREGIRNTFTAGPCGRQESANVKLVRANNPDFRDAEALATYTIQKAGTKHAAPIENTVYHAQIAEPSAPIPKPVVTFEPPKPKPYSIKTKQYYFRSEWYEYFETEEQAREALAKLMETEKARLARENDDPRCEYELLYDRKDCIENMEIYKNHNKVATVRK